MYLNGDHSGLDAVWSENEIGFDVNDVSNLQSGFNAIRGGQFIVKLTVTDGPCIASDSVVVLLTEPIRAPNVFTPNGDGEFDTFFIEGVESHPGAVVRIYNRWGKLIYETADYEVNEWDVAISVRLCQL